jgi:hypothetical protein
VLAPLSCTHNNKPTNRAQKPMYAEIVEVRLWLWLMRGDGCSDTAARFLKQQQQGADVL